MTTHERWLSPPSSPTIVGSAVATIVWSRAARNIPSMSAAKTVRSARPRSRSSAGGAFDRASLAPGAMPQWVAEASCAASGRGEARSGGGRAAAASGAAGAAPQRHALHGEEDGEPDDQAERRLDQGQEDGDGQSRRAGDCITRVIGLTVGRHHAVR